MSRFIGPLTKAQAQKVAARARAAPRQGRKRSNASNPKNTRPLGPGSSGPGPRRGSKFGQTVAPSAMMSRARQLGMSDIRSHTVSWLAGYVYVGNGTLGATDGVYVVDPTKATTLIPNSGIGANSGALACLEADSLTGASYAQDIIKHYARRKILRAFADIVSLNTSSANSMTAVAAPVRANFSVATTDSKAVAGNTYTNTLSIAGQQQCASWESMRIDLSASIAGGTGAAQNEFDNQLGVAATTTIYGQGPTISKGVVPAGLIVSGVNSTAALRGTATHSIILTEIVDLLDYVGGSSTSEPAVDLKKIDLKEPHRDAVSKVVSSATSEMKGGGLNRFSLINDDVKSLYEEEVDSKTVIFRRSEPIPILAAGSAKDKDGKKSK